MRDFIWSLVPHNWYYRIAWLMIEVFKSKNKAWLAIYKMKLREDGYIQEVTDHKKAEINRAVSVSLKAGLERARARRKVEKNKK